MNNGFVKLMRSKATSELAFKDHNAFILLTQIAIRANRGDFNTAGLSPGQALVGDYKAAGLTRQMYRSALHRLKKYGILTTQATNKGTVATLCNSDIYDINISDTNHQDNHQATNDQPSSNHQATTNKNKRIKEEKNINKKEAELPEFLFKVSGIDVFSIQEFMESKFQIFLHERYKSLGEDFVKQSIREFEQANNEGVWKDESDLRKHISNYMNKKNLDNWQTSGRSGSPTEKLYSVPGTSRKLTETEYKQMQESKKKQNIYQEWMVQGANAAANSARYN